MLDSFGAKRLQVVHLDDDDYESLSSNYRVDSVCVEWATARPQLELQT